VFQRPLPILLVACLLVSCGGAEQDASALSPAQQTAEQNPACQRISPFYFEIGNAGGAITSASIGGGAYTATTQMSIASGTKWLFGAYVAEVRSGVFSTADLRALRMQSGYVSMGPFCGPLLTTVAACFADASNDTLTATSIDRFDYGSGHFQKWGVDNGLGPMGTASLTAEFQNKLGPGIPADFGSPTLAGGAIMSASGYAGFLRKILRNELRIAALLGTDPVCTLPLVCPDADYSPVSPLAWHYSIGHWVEDDFLTGDGSFSSPGALGFYPWIDSTKTYYGVVAHEKVGANIVSDSIECGRAIRKAFVTGVVQL
jgi:hypothetical protein